MIELASFNRFSEIHQTFLEQLTESIGIVLNTIEANTRTEGLLQKSQEMGRELQSQQEELQQTNEELGEKARLLAEQKAEVERKNLEVEQAKLGLEEKAQQLSLTSKYKSEFLANMSHELRTPLNSLLILSQQLAENPDKNLLPKQVEFASTIHASGSDLLNLINDILDLSKIESGTVAVETAEVLFADLQSDLERTFRHMADTKGFNFSIELASTLPRGLSTDTKRLQQVLKNLLSNAFKFTERGQVTLRIGLAHGGWSPEQDRLNGAKAVVAFSVQDTGIGIPADKQKIIFEAFQQADGSTSRKYGGTGLGLAISREIAHLLGGELRLVRSIPGEGSTFTLFVPQIYFAEDPKPVLPGDSGGSGAARPASDRSAREPAGHSAEVDDDRGSLQPGDRIVLIAEDDVNFAKVLLETARARGFKGLVTTRGRTALAMAQEYKPDAITLDIQMPDLDGWAVLNRLKLDPTLRHIPVHIISVESDAHRAVERGAIGSLEKPATQEALQDTFVKMREFLEHGVRHLLLVEDDDVQRRHILDVIGNHDVHTTVVGTGAEALAALNAQHFDCMVLDLGLPDMTGFQVLESIHEISALRTLPVIIYTARDLTNEEETRLKKLAQTIIVKGVRSPERLLDETALFLHRVAAHLPGPKRQIIEQLYQADTGLTGKKVLVVDDDVRNVFALTSVLERQQMEVLSAENGRMAVEILNNTPDIHVVLMDVMMPDMDGYETMRTIRRITRFRSLPILALTAKAMKGDREKCLEAGASDYIAKPVNSQQLVSLLRVWLYR